MNTETEIKTPRCTVSFKGTIRYASVNCHKNQELGPKDDAESWLYMISKYIFHTFKQVFAFLVELMSARGLPWKKLTDRNIVLRSKEDARKAGRNNFLPPVECSVEFGLMLDYMDRLGIRCLIIIIFN